MNANTMPLEAATRLLIDRNLENLGWKLTGRDQNVYCEQPRTEAEKKKLEGEIKRVEGKLNNQGFVAKAPQKVIDEEREKGIKYKEMLDKVLKSIEDMKNLK